MDKDNWLADCRAACKRIKYLGEDLTWDERPNHSGWFRAAANLLDETGTTIPGLEFQGEYRPLEAIGEAVTSYALMFRDGRDVYRVCMLEVYPQHKLAHREPGIVIFGPHILIGDPRLEHQVRAVISKLNLGEFPEWIKRFKRHVNLRDGDHPLISIAGKIFG